ncbi:MAG: glycosyltransferase [Leeuwenhoekiella sp.]
MEDTTAIDKLSETLNSYFNKALKKEIVITIPAKNEEETIIKTLESIRIQQNPDASFLDSNLFEVIVLCNNCTDKTYQLCVDFKAKYPDFPLINLVSNSQIINNVGAARRILMNIACTRLVENGFIVTTDADTIADEFWVYNLHEYMNSSYDLVCGLILVDDSDLDCQAKKYLQASRNYMDLMCRLEAEIYPDVKDPWPKHPFNSGPNMAIRKYAYKKIGGMPPLHNLEDIAMFDLVVSHGFVTKHCIKTIVTTSTRKVPRAPSGFGDQLMKWSVLDDKKDTCNVQSLERLKVKFKAFEMIRNFYTSRESQLIFEIAALIDLPVEKVQELYDKNERYQSLVRYLETALLSNEIWSIKYPDINIFSAIKDLESHFGCNKNIQTYDDFFQRKSS